MHRHKSTGQENLYKKRNRKLCEDAYIHTYSRQRLTKETERRTPKSRQADSQTNKRRTVEKIGEEKTNIKNEKENTDMNTKTLMST